MCVRDFLRAIAPISSVCSLGLYVTADAAALDLYARLAMYSFFLSLRGYSVGEKERDLRMYIYAHNVNVLERASERACVRAA